MHTYKDTPIIAEGTDCALYEMWAGQCGPTRAYVFARSFEDAFEAFVEYLDDHSPGLLCDVDEGDLREAAEDLGFEWRDEWPDWSDERFARVAERAEADLTAIGHTTLKNGTHIQSWEWGGSEVTDAETIEACRRIVANRFEAIYETEPGHAVTLASAFAVAHEAADLWPALRMARRLTVHDGGDITDLTGYVHGPRFPEADRDGDLSETDFLAIRDDEAHPFLERLAERLAG